MGTKFAFAGKRNCLLFGGLYEDDFGSEEFLGSTDKRDDLFGYRYLSDKSTTRLRCIDAVCTKVFSDFFFKAVRFISNASPSAASVA